MARAKVRDGNGNGDGAQVRAGSEDGVRTGAVGHSWIDPLDPLDPLEWIAGVGFLMIPCHGRNQTSVRERGAC